MSAPGRSTRFFLIGGHLAIDFANTVRGRVGSSDPLGSWEDLVAFLTEAQTVDAPGARRLLTLARTTPRRCTTVFAWALRLRDTLRGVLGAMETGAKVRPQWIAVINGALRAGAGAPQLVADGDTWRLTLVTAPANPASVLFPIARSAAELLEGRRAGVVRQCANPHCVLYFYDPSPTGRRRWCSMAVCGNRMKVAHFAHRRRAPHNAS